MGRGKKNKKVGSIIKQGSTVRLERGEFSLRESNMMNKIKDLRNKVGNKEETVEESSISQLNNACAALLVEIAFADKDVDETEKTSLKQTLITTYSM